MQTTNHQLVIGCAEAVGSCGHAVLLTLACGVVQSAISTRPWCKPGWGNNGIRGNNLAFFSKNVLEDSVF